MMMMMITIIRMKTIQDRTEQDSKKRERLSEAQESGNWNNFKSVLTRKAKEFKVRGEGESKQRNTEYCFRQKGQTLEGAINLRTCNEIALDSKRLK